MSEPRIDPITFEVLRNALTEVTEMMSLALRRSAYSTNIKTRADFSCALFDDQLQPVAQSFSQANHLGSLVKMVPNMVTEYGPERSGGRRCAGRQRSLSGRSASERHSGRVAGHRRRRTDRLGGESGPPCRCRGGAPASIGAFREVFQEGIIIPPVKLVEAGAIVSDVFALTLSQVRAKRETAGDFRAQFAANVTGAQRFTALARSLWRRGDAPLHRRAHRLYRPANQSESSMPCPAAHLRRRAWSIPTGSLMILSVWKRRSRSRTTGSPSISPGATRSAARQ